MARSLPFAHVRTQLITRWCRSAFPAMTDLGDVAQPEERRLPNPGPVGVRVLPSPLHRAVRSSVSTGARAFWRPSRPVGI